MFIGLSNISVLSLLIFIIIESLKHATGVSNVHACEHPFRAQLPWSRSKILKQDTLMFNSASGYESRSEPCFYCGGHSSG